MVNVAQIPKSLFMHAYILKLDQPHQILEEFIQCFRWNLHTDVDKKLLSQV